MPEKTYTGEQVKKMLGESMLKFQTSMIAIIREAARHRDYRDLTGYDALNKVAERIEEAK